MPNYAHKIKYLYPTATKEDFRLQDNSDGNGVYIVFWNTSKLGTEPTLAALDAGVDDATADADNADKVQDVKFNRDTNKAIGLTMKDFLNEIMAGRTAPITSSELKAKFKSYL